MCHMHTPVVNGLREDKDYTVSLFLLSHSCLGFDTGAAVHMVQELYIWNILVVSFGFRYIRCKPIHQKFSEARLEVLVPCPMANAVW